MPTEAPQVFQAGLVAVSKGQVCPGHEHCQGWHVRKYCLYKDLLLYQWASLMTR